MAMAQQPRIRADSSYEEYGFIHGDDGLDDLYAQFWVVEKRSLLEPL